MKRDERNSKISNILLPWQHSRFEPLLIRNTIISFSTPQQRGHNGISLAFGIHWHSQISFGLQQSEIVYLLDNERNISKLIEKGFGTQRAAMATKNLRFRLLMLNRKCSKFYLILTRNV